MKRVKSNVLWHKFNVLNYSESVICLTILKEVEGALSCHQRCEWTSCKFIWKLSNGVPRVNSHWMQMFFDIKFGFKLSYDKHGKPTESIRKKSLSNYPFYGVFFRKLFLHWVERNSHILIFWCSSSLWITGVFVTLNDTFKRCTVQDGNAIHLH